MEHQSVINTLEFIHQRQDFETGSWLERKCLRMPSSKKHGRKSGVARGSEDLNRCCPYVRESSKTAVQCGSVDDMDDRAKDVGRPSLADTLLPSSVQVGVRYCDRKEGCGVRPTCRNRHLAVDGRRKRDNKWAAWNRHHHLLASGRKWRQAHAVDWVDTTSHELVAHDRRAPRQLLVVSSKSIRLFDLVLKSFDGLHHLHLRLLQFLDVVHRSGQDSSLARRRAGFRWLVGATRWSWVARQELLYSSDPTVYLVAPSAFHFVVRCSPTVVARVPPHGGRFERPGGRHWKSIAHNWAWSNGRVGRTNVLIWVR